MKGTWVTSVINTLSCELPWSWQTPGYRIPILPPVPKGPGQSFALQQGFLTPLLRGQGWDRQPLPENGRPSAWNVSQATRCLIGIGFHIRLLDRIPRVFPPRCSGELQRTWRSRARPTQQRGSDILVSCRGRSSLRFPSITQPSRLRGADLFLVLPPSLLNHIWTWPST